MARRVKDIFALEHEAQAAVARGDGREVEGGAIAFRSRRVEPSADGEALRVEGDLDLLGTMRPVGFDLTAGDDGRLTGRARVRQTDFGLTPYKLYFFHLNNRHHSFAVVGSGRRGLHHFMVELCSLDDVGQGYDLAQLDEGRVAFTLGRHTNDHMTSFYANAPSGFFVEYGWGAREIHPGDVSSDFVREKDAAEMAAMMKKMMIETAAASP